MKVSTRFIALAAPVALLALGACATPFRADVSRFQALPAPQGQSFVVQAEDPDLQGGLEFSHYARLVSDRLVQHGYQPAASADQATLVVTLDYGVDNGRERIVSRPSFGFNDYYGGFYRPWYGRWGRYGRAGFIHGFHDPFLFGGFGYPEIDSYTIYTSDLDMEIKRASDGQNVFEGTAKAISRDDDLTELVPNLIEAMFTGFPGNSGEEVRITVTPPEERR